MIYDFAVSGASFAGLSFSQACTAQGRKGIILEKKKSHHDFIHTTGIVVQETADLVNLPLHLCKKINAVKLYSPSLKSMTLTRPGYNFYCTDTSEFLTEMLRSVEASGVKICMATPFKNAQRQNGLLKVNHDIHTKFLVGADGARSKVAKHFNLSQNKKFLTGIEWEFDRIGKVDDQCLHVFISKKYAPGYIGWIVPGPVSYQVGLAVKDGLKPNLKPFIEHLSKRFDFSQSTVFNHRGGLIPCGGPLPNSGNDKVLLLGDAAGTVSPLTAGGIHKAIEIGSTAGIWLHNYLNNDGSRPDKVMRECTPSYRFKNIMRSGMNQLQPSDKVIDHLFESRLFKSFAQTVFFHHRGIFSFKAWKDIVGLLKT